MLAEQNIKSQVLESRQRFDRPTSGVRIFAEGIKILRFIKVDSIGEDTKRVDMRLGGLSASFSSPRHIRNRDHKAVRRCYPRDFGGYFLATHLPSIRSERLNASRLLRPSPHRDIDNTHECRSRCAMLGLQRQPQERHREKTGQVLDRRVRRQFTFRNRLPQSLP